MSRSRRAFLANSSALLCACAGHANADWFKGTRPKLAVKPDIQTVSYDQVQLTESRLQTQLDHQRDLFMGLDDDRLLKPFRSRAGQAAPGEDMGGWYDDSRDFHVDPNDWSTANWHGYIPGHSFGQYVSGLSRNYAISRDEKVRIKVEGLVLKYIPTISPKFFEGYYLPAYTYNKLVVGLIDAYRYAGVKEAGAALDKLTDAVLPYLPGKALTREERRARPYTSEADIWDEPYTLPENLFLAWELGLGERYKILALRYMQNEALFDPLAAGVSPLKGKHAYSHVNALNSAVQAYLATGEARYFKAAQNGFTFVANQSYATGGWGPNEELVASDDTETLFEMLKSTHRTFETPCGAFGHFKITRSLLQLTQDSRYGDSMERVLYNTVLGAKPTEPNGNTFYYSDYNETATKFFRSEKWPCCSGTFVQLTADYGISAYFRKDDDIYVNLYIPSRLSVAIDGNKLAIEQVTQYPLSNTVRINVDPASPKRFGIMLRIPGWAGADTRISLNGEAFTGVIRPGTFLEISRLWTKGDRIDISFDMGMRLEPLNAAHPETVALMTGPLALFPIDAKEKPMARKAWLTAARRGPEEWTVQSATDEIRLKPFMSIQNETYRLYSTVLD